MQMNRFMWEDVEKLFRKNKRVRSILKFDNVLVSSTHINQTKKDKFLDFLAIESCKYLIITMK